MKKYSSDEGMQNLFENFRKSVDEELGRALNEIDSTNLNAQLADFMSKLENLDVMEPSSDEVKNFLGSLSTVQGYGKDIIEAVNLVNKDLAHAIKSNNAEASIKQPDLKAFRDAVLGLSFNLSDQHGSYNADSDGDMKVLPVDRDAMFVARKFVKEILPLIYKWRN
jgi:hypothetical protein